jgi:thiol-disulfide isomerase/thioredoxin
MVVRRRGYVSVNDSAQHYKLYGTSACHLCDMAEELLLALAGEGADISFEKVDISESDKLFERFSLRIPVLANAAGAELDWPFSAGEVSRFLG